MTDKFFTEYQKRRFRRIFYLAEHGLATKQCFLGYAVHTADKLIFTLDFNGVGMTEFVKAMVGFDYATRDLGFFFAIAGTAFNDLTKSVIYCDTIGRAFMKLLYTTADMQ